MSEEYLNELQHIITAGVKKNFGISPGDGYLEKFELKAGIILHFPRDIWIYCHWPPPAPDGFYHSLTLDYEGISETEARIIILNDSAASAAEDAAKNQN